MVTLKATDSSSITPWSWRTNAAWSFQKRRRREGFQPVVSVPSTSTRPLVGSWSNPRQCSRVVLPEPLGPTSAVMVPGGHAVRACRTTSRPSMTTVTSSAPSFICSLPLDFAQADVCETPPGGHQVGQGRDEQRRDRHERNQRSALQSLEQDDHDRQNGTGDPLLGDSTCEDLRPGLAGRPQQEVTPGLHHGRDQGSDEGGQHQGHDQSYQGDRLQPGEVGAELCLQDPFLGDVLYEHLVRQSVLIDQGHGGSEAGEHDVPARGRGREEAVVEQVGQAWGDHDAVSYT